jgi:hypothetical protein
MRRVAIAAAVVSAIAPSSTFGSGDPPPSIGYVFAEPQDAAERDALGRGELGIVKTAASDALLYLDWRLLNGLRVGRPAADALADPCCGERTNATYDWLEARSEVLGGTDGPFSIATERPGPNYTSTPVCFNDAFVSAAATLRDRVKRFGSASGAVRLWIASQDAVFEACSKSGVVLPALPATAPQWLRADQEYQGAAIALYDGRLEAAARGFARIARDPASPWHPRGLYLEARSLLRAALVESTPLSFATARGAIDRLAAASPGSYGQSESGRMRQLLDFRERPAQLLSRLDRELGATQPMKDIAVALRDYMTLSDKAAVRPEAADWIRTVQSKDRVAGLAHAGERWRATGRSAWLVAALGLAEAGDRDAAPLVQAADGLKPDEPVWITARYHRLRLRIHADAPAVTREHVDHVLARRDLSRSDRNIFTALRMQVAADLSDFAAHLTRSPYCDVEGAPCVEQMSPARDGLVGRRGNAGGFLGLGPDARAIIDQLPIDQRVALAADRRLPQELRLDIALTSYARAVQLQNHAMVDRTAGMLAGLLPQLRGDWNRIARLRPGPDKRFAEFFVMAKIPSLRVDLADYERPVGTVAQFRGYWSPWLLIPAGRSPSARPFPTLYAYLPGGYWVLDTAAEPEQYTADLACLGLCGAAATPLRLPSFAAVAWPRAKAERAYFRFSSDSPTPDTDGSMSLWDETLAHVRAHSRDPRAPETLYRLIRVARWGGNHDQLGRRAFRLLHARYPRSVWAKRSPFWYD